MNILAIMGMGSLYSLISRDTFPNVSLVSEQTGC